MDQLAQARNAQVEPQPESTDVVVGVAEPVDASQVIARNTHSHPSTTPLTSLNRNCVLDLAMRT